jgi:hypothetical protein
MLFEKLLWGDGDCFEGEKAKAMRVGRGEEDIGTASQAIRIDLIGVSISVRGMSAAETYVNSVPSSPNSIIVLPLRVPSVASTRPINSFFLVSCAVCCSVSIPLSDTGCK